MEKDIVSADVAVAPKSATVDFAWLKLQCLDYGTPMIESAAREIARRHQSEIRGLSGTELDDMVERVWLGYASEAKAALWAMIHYAEENFRREATAPPQVSPSAEDKTIDDEVHA